MSITVLPSARARDAASNLVAIIARGKHEVAAFGPDIDFDSPVWLLQSDRRASASHQAVTLYFTTHEGGSSKGMNGRTPLSEPFASFIKAIIRLRHDKKAKTAQNHAVILRAGRYLHDCLGAKDYDPSRLNAQDFVLATHSVREREEPSSRYRIGLMLEEIADWINRYNLASVRIDFKNPYPRHGHTDSRITDDARERREQLLPSNEALDALAQIANLVSDDSDILRVRCVELLVCGGWRINELLTLPFNCEVCEVVTRNGTPVLGEDGEPEEAYGIRYFAEKGGGPRIKWIPTAMGDVARRAIADIRRITAPSREVAEWNEANPGRAWLLDGWQGRDPRSVVTSKQVAKALGIGDGGAFLRHRDMVRLVNGRETTTLAELEQRVLSETQVVHIGGALHPLSQFLFLMPVNWSHQTRGTIAPMLGLVQDQQISDMIVGRSGVRTIFERFGFSSADGTPIQIRSHQFRHWLNTLAQEGGMSEMEIARWSGRKDIGQNAAYDHTSGVQLAERAREMLAAGKVVGALAVVHDRLPLASREGFRRAQFATAHTTDLGMCVNDWSLLPCMEHGNCATCSQHIVVKGNPSQRARAAQLLEERQFLLNAAEAELVDETYGASNFVAQHRRMRDAATAILAVHDDSEIEDGSLVQIDLALRAVVPLPLDVDQGSEVEVIDAV